MIEFTPEQTAFIADNRTHYDTLIKAEYLTNIGHEIKDGLLNIARVFDPGYQANLWCGPCVCDLVKYAYVQYDKWVAEQPVEVAVEAPLIHKATFPKHDQSIGGYQPTGDIKTSPPKGGSGVPAKRKYKKRKKK